MVTLLEAALVYLLQPLFFMTKSEGEDMYLLFLVKK